MKKKQIKRYIRKKIRWWVRWMGLGQWRVNCDWEKAIPSRMPPYNVAANCECSWMYQEATITFAMDQMKKLDKEDLEEVVIHELMHVFLHEMRNYEKDPGHEERVATQLTKAFIWVKQGLAQENHR